MNFNDDELIQLKDDSGENHFDQSGGVQVEVKHERRVALEETKLKVLVEVTGVGDNIVRSPVDLVAVLDVSGSMGGSKLEKLTTAMQFLIKKLGSVDRLSVVTFSSSSVRLFPLLQITETSQADIEKHVLDLKAGGATNIADGLTTGLRVLNERRLNEGRSGAIMLMSDGEQNEGDATKVQVGNVPVHTFGFGVDYEPEVLSAIAKNSNGGTFSDVQNQSNLNIVFSHCLGGLLTIVVQELDLMISTKTKDTPPEKEAKIEKVHAGSYPKTESNNSVAVSFGELYNKEVRKIMLELLLFGVETERSADVLIVTYKYRTSKGKLLSDFPPKIVKVTRTGSPVKKNIPAMIVEEKRIETVETVKETRGIADNNELDKAKEKLDKAENNLVDAADVPDPCKMIYSLKIDVQQLSKHMERQDTYVKKGRPYALAFESSHERQRYSARGDDLEMQRAFATPRMDAYLEQAKEFDKDPTKPPPPEKDDVKKESPQNPPSPICPQNPLPPISPQNPFSPIHTSLSYSHVYTAAASTTRPIWAIYLFVLLLILVAILVKIFCFK